jgi:hypothetical protein
MASFLDKVFADFDEKSARDELEHARREVQAMQDTLSAYERWRDRQRGEHGVQTTSADTNGSKTRSGGRAVIRQLIREAGYNVKWTTPKVREALGLDREADHSIQVSLSRLMRSGELVRPELGVYILPPPDEDSGEEGVEPSGTPSASGAGKT